MSLRHRNVDISNPPVLRSQLTNAFSVGRWEARCTKKWLETEEAVDGTTLALPIWHWMGNCLYSGYQTLQADDEVRVSCPKSGDHLAVQITDPSTFMWCQKVPDEPWTLTQICGSLKGHQMSTIHLAVHIQCDQDIQSDLWWAGLDIAPDLNMTIDGKCYWFPYFQGSLTPVVGGSYLLQGNSKPYM